MRTLRNVLKLALFAGLATVATGPSAEARQVHPNQQTAYQQLVRSLRQQQRISLRSVQQSAITQLQGLNFARNHHLISRSAYLADRASLLSNFRLARNDMLGLIRSENSSLAHLNFELRTGQISFAQFSTQAQKVISASHQQQLALIAKVQAGLIHPATPF
jgi:hypothetical protein